MFVIPNILDALRAQLSRVRPGFGAGKTLVMSMLTDAFSPELTTNGITEKALKLVLEKTCFRIRILTKNAIVGSPFWIEFFLEHRERFVVGLSTGTLDDDWAAKVEIGTSSPTARLRALHRLQAAGVATFGMACPIFPDVLVGGGVERLLDLIRPALVEDLWAEPFNDRDNWENVRGGYATGSEGHDWLTNVFADGRRDLWSEYATKLYVRLRDKALTEGWIDKLTYLLYEGNIAASDAAEFASLRGVSLQSKVGPDGRTQNRHLHEWDTREP